MDILVAYDVETTSEEGKRRLRHVATICKDFGQRVQFSVFECRIDTAQMEELEARLRAAIDPAVDSLRIYMLPPGRDRAVRVIGVDRYVDFGGPLIL